MGAGSSSVDCKDFHAGPDFPAEVFGKTLSSWCEPLRLECSPPFQVGWYNRKRQETAGGLNAIDAPDGAVGYAIYSVPGYLDVVVEHFARERPEKDFVDHCTDHILDQIREGIPKELDAMLVNTDSGPPYYHVQTVGAVAGVDEHVEAEDLHEESDEAWREDLSDRLEDSRDRKMWGTDPETLRKIFGVNVHPAWGGWYAYRALIVLKGVTAESLTQPEPVSFLAPDQARRILSEYNLRHELCGWRDLEDTGHPTERRYKPDEYLFFTETSGLKRRRFLEMRAAELATPPEPRRP